MKTNIKMIVTPEQSKKVQEICFANDVYWVDGDDEVSELNRKYIEISNDDIFFIPGSNYFNKSESKEIDADLFIRTNGTCEEERSKTEREQQMEEKFIKELINSEDQNHLNWIYYRLINVYKENKNMDYMQKFKKIIDLSDQIIKDSKKNNKLNDTCEEEREGSKLSNASEEIKLGGFLASERQIKDLSRAELVSLCRQIIKYEDDRDIYILFKKELLKRLENNNMGVSVAPIKKP